MAAIRSIRPVLLRVALTSLMMFGLFVVAAANPPHAQAARSCLYFEFDKGTNINSTLYWRWMDQFGRCIYSDSWRAGSGVSTDPCAPNAGWLPNGWYDLGAYGHQDGWGGTLIQGRVWQLQDKVCSDGVHVRTELFIHTEETQSRGQSCTSAADDLFCWDKTAACSTCGAGTNDFKSEGCIKVRRKSSTFEGGTWPDAMSAVHNDWHAFYGQASNRADTVYVHS